MTDSQIGNNVAIIGKSPSLLSVMDLALKMAKTDFSVFISGESGVGKGVFARFIQKNSPRYNKPFIILSCADLPESMLEDVLFGHEKGAFTSAVASQTGKFELADKGTLFLDEIGDLSPTAQGKLLRVLQDKELERLGGSKTIKVDVRVISATNKDIQKMIADGEFREDLFFRLKSIQLNIPPLRNHLEDVSDLVQHFLIQKNNGQGKYLHPNTFKALKQHPYSSNNIRELECIIESAIALVGDDPCIRPEHLEFPPPRFLNRIELAIDKNNLNIDRHIAPLKNILVQEAMIKHHGVKIRAAKELGISLFYLEKLRKNPMAPSQKYLQYITNEKTDKKPDTIDLSQEGHQEQLSLEKLDTKSKTVVEIAEKNELVTNRRIQGKLGISPSTAKRLLSSLVKRKILHKEGIGKSSNYVLSSLSKAEK